jgi:hypothetical protein
MYAAPQAAFVIRACGRVENHALAHLYSGTYDRSGQNLACRADFSVRGDRGRRMHQRRQLNTCGGNDPGQFTARAASGA